MKTRIFYCFLLPILLLNSSCRHNRLKINEKMLAKEIESQEEKANLQSNNIQHLPDTLRKGPNIFRQKEDRSVDPAHKPVTIDIAGNLNNIREIKLSHIASEIQYIRLEQVPDTSFKRDIVFMYHLADDFIIAVNIYGIVQYTLDGKYVRTIVRNEFTHMQAMPREDGSYGVMSYSNHTFVGSNDIKARIEGNTLNYSYENNITGQEFLMQFNCSELKAASPGRFDPEDPLKITGLGKPIIDLNHGRMTNALTQLKAGGMLSTSAPIPSFSSQSYAINWINNDTYTKKLRGDIMLGVFNKYGDTLATFRQYERLVNYTKSLQRGTDYGSQYEFNNKMYFRNAFNDTICQIIPPNRLLPVYVLDLADYKVTRQEGVDPGFNLTGKIIIESWAETEKFILLTFTKDNYDCPANRKSRNVKIYHALFSKEEKQLIIIKGDPFNYEPEILENDIDGGIPVWPSYYEIGKNGSMLLSVKGKTLKKRIKSEQFKLSDATETKKNELRQLAGSVSDYEDILMVIK
jgi:hypothetical protein